jgi:DNA invertase Pin-like site-specific DNA recombinase
MKIAEGYCNIMLVSYYILQYNKRIGGSTMLQKNLAIGYTRVSTGEQVASGLSLEAQAERIRAYAKMRGLELVDIITDAGISGGVPFGDRPGGGDVLRRIRKGEAGAVIVLKLDRAFRDTVDALSTIDAWERRGVSLHVCDLGGAAVDTSSANGRFMLTVLAAAAEMERYQVKERTRTALGAKRARREKTGGAVPFGFVVSKDGRTLRPDATEQKTIKIIVRARKRNDSLRKIAERLNRRGIKTKAGASWKAPQVARALKNAERYAAAV